MNNEFVDLEWEKASAANEQEEYYRVTTPNNGHFIKRYKPSVAALVRKRTTNKMELIKGSKRKR